MMREKILRRRGRMVSSDVESICDMTSSTANVAMIADGSSSTPTRTSNSKPNDDEQQRQQQ